MTLQIGFVGTGGIARAHQNHLSSLEGVTVAGFTGTRMAHSDKAAREWKDARAYESLEQMLDDRRLDAVYICVPPDSHDGLEELLIDRGIPFLVEKPLGTDLALPRRLAARIREQNLLTSVGYHWRYLDSAQKAKELLLNTKIGMSLGYWMGTMPRAPWWIVQKGSGGQFVEQTTHITDLLRYLVGEITEVYAAYSHRVMHEVVEGADVSDVGTVTMKLADGSVATISNTCLIPNYHTVGLDIYTNDGIYEIREACLKRATADTVTQYNNQTKPMYNENEAFIRALRTGDRSGILSDYEDSLKTHEVTMAANESARTGLPVKVPGIGA
ncbi:Gfo/Idh/MocA family oxidoreductase [Paenibacillus sp. CC-CFT747]|nr:Gfo/Idh/MocA family oxidoreductase [Paenibacillus sp. CC-CFT747]